MAPWRLDGKPRIARRYTTYKNCPLPTPEDRLLFILVYLKTYPLQAYPTFTLLGDYLDRACLRSVRLAPRASPLLLNGGQSVRVSHVSTSRGFVGSKRSGLFPTEVIIFEGFCPLQVVQGRLFGMGQSKAHQWIHVLLVVLRAALRTLGDTPTRSVAELAMRLGVAEADAAALVEAPEESPPGGDRPAAAESRAASPLLGTMAPNGASSAPSIQLSRRAVIAARKSAIRSKTYC